MNPLTNILTPRIRGVLYAVLFVLTLVFAAWQASDGNWLEFAAALVTSLFSATAASNASYTQTDDLDDEVDTPFDFEG